MVSVIVNAYEGFSVPLNFLAMRGMGGRALQVAARESGVFVSGGNRIVNYITFVAFYTMDNGSKRIAPRVASMHSPSRQAGLTLIELLVTMAVLIISVAYAVPSFQNHIKDNRKVTQINELVSAMNLARSEATKGGGSVALCPSTNATGCGGGNFDNGWIIFINSDADVPPAVDVGETILRTHAGTAGAGASLRASSSLAAGFNFLGSGRPTSFGDITYCDDRGAAYAYSVGLNLVGIIKASGTHADGSALTCP